MKNCVLLTCWFKKTGKN